MCVYYRTQYGTRYVQININMITMIPPGTARD